jgi:NTE family protein
MKEGEAAVRAMSASLVALALPEAQYAAYELKRLSAPLAIDQPVQLTKLEMAPSGRINPKELEVQTGLKWAAGDQRAGHQAGNLLFGRGDLARVETEVRDDENGRSVLIKPTEADWAHSRLRVGLELNSDFSDNSAFELKAMHVLSSLNDWGASCAPSRSVGTSARWARSSGSRWAPARNGMSRRRWNSSGASDIFSSTGFRQARYAYDTGGHLVGRLGRWGDLRYSVAPGRQGAPDDTGRPDQQRVSQTVQA